jgi:predicted metalloprotease with PDZ domain
MTEPILYTLRLPRPEWHEVEVEASFPTAGRSEVDLMMAVWAPGSYVIREFARNVDQIAAATEDGAPLPLEKVTKNRWRAAAAGARRIVVRYRLYARELSVRTNFVDGGFALINGAATFLTLADDYHRPHEVRLARPAEWRVAISALPAIEGEEDAWRAADFAHLVDSPLYAGNAHVYSFEVGGTPHLLLNEGEEGGLWDGPRSVVETERVVRAAAELWGAIPYSRYVFFNLIAEGKGGLEHRDSSVLMTSRFRTRCREGWLEWLGLVGHELFHAWNVKRLRPIELDEESYEREVYTRSLWQVEGVTAYYDDLLVHRAGLSTRAEYLRQLGRQIEALETTPGRRVQPLGAASFDAWIKYYRRDENFSNSGVSYYTKGAVVAFLLDAKIRRATDGGRSLDDVLRLAYRRYSGAHGYRPEELRAAVSEVAGMDLSPWLAAALDTTADLDYEEAWDWFGLRLSTADPAGGDGRSQDCAALLGVETETQGGRLSVTHVRRDGAAHRAGVNVGDEILAIGDFRVPPEGLRERLMAYRPGTAETLLLARRERLVRLPVVFDAAPAGRLELVPDPAASAAQRRRLDGWLPQSAITARREPRGRRAKA